MARSNFKGEFPVGGLEQIGYDAMSEAVDGAVRQWRRVEKTGGDFGRHAGSVVGDGEAETGLVTVDADAYAAGTRGTGRVDRRMGAQGHRGIAGEVDEQAFEDLLVERKEWQTGGYHHDYGGVRRSQGAEQGAERADYGRRGLSDYVVSGERVVAV